MAFGLLETQMPQPTYGSSIFDAAQGTPVNNPYLQGYNTDYAAREAAFSRDPGQYTQYRWGDTTPAPVPTTGLQGGLFANNDVYGQRDGGGGNDGPMGPSNNTPPSPAQTTKSGVLGIDMNDIMGSISDMFGGDKNTNAPGTTIGDFSYGEDDGPLSGVHDRFSTAYNAGTAAALGLSTLGGLGISGITGIMERAALQEALNSVNAPPLSGWQSFKSLLPGPTQLGFANQNLIGSLNSGDDATIGAPTGRQIGAAGAYASNPDNRAGYNRGGGGGGGGGYGGGMSSGDTDSSPGGKGGV